MDIIIFAAIAIFIIFKLKQQFGKINDEQKRDSIKKLIKEKTNQVNNSFINFNKKNNTPPQETVTLENPAPYNYQQARLELAKIADEQESAKILAKLDENLQVTLNDILRICSISAFWLLKIFNKTMETIVAAFAGGKEGDLATLKLLLCDKIYQHFAKAIEQRNLENKILVSKIISIDSSDIIAASMNDGHASITVKLVTKQINFITDKENNILEGKKDLITIVNDCWMFTKDLTLTNSPWQVSSTNCSN
jgi:hypothetical protein